MSGGVLAGIRARPRLSALVAIVATAVLVAGVTRYRRVTADSRLTATVRKGTLAARLTATGVLKPEEAITYASPLGGREAEITFLVPEGTRVGEGDLLVRLDTTQLQNELERLGQELRQAQVDLQVAEIDRQEAKAAIDSLAEGEGALNIEETRTRLQAAERKADRLRNEFRTLTPLMEKGFITREELQKTGDALEQAEEEMTLARRRADVLIQRTNPRDRKRAELQLAQKDAQLENVRARLLEAQAHVKILRDQIENCSIYARRPGLVVFEDYLQSSPRRKMQMGDRVTGSQGLVTIPDVHRMFVEASTSEADVHRVQPGQTAAIRLEAFPSLRLTGKVVRVGTLARSSVDRPLGDKRFDLIVAVDPSDAELRPEMTARIDIALGERPDVLLIPVNAVFDRQGLLVSHVVGLAGIETRPVQLGESNDLEVEVVAGLNEGDRVSLTDATGTVAPAAAAGPGPGATRLRGTDYAGRGR